MAEFVFCVECGNRNKISAKFCSNCGSSLILLQKEKLKCNKCGYENDTHINYCASCGSKLKQKGVNRKEKEIEHSQSKKQEVPQNKSWYLNPLVIVSILVIAMFVSYLIIDGKTQKQSQSTNQSQVTFEKVNDNAELEKKVIEVASKFICACGSCGEEPLETCSCQTAQEERQFIRQALQQGQTIDEVITTVNVDYGWIKNEYKSKYGNGKLSLDTKLNLNQDIAGVIKSTDQDKGQIASFANRIEIISHFACGCGQCDLDELKDCECDHPGGAKEVKQFIDEKIKRGIYTADKIIEFVEHKYASRIR